MNDRKFNEVTKFFENEVKCDSTTARKFAGYVDNIVFNARMEDNDPFIYTVALGIRNAYWQGQMDGIFTDEEFEN